MKKILCCILVIAMIASCITVFADNADSQDMGIVLAEVKKKVEVPEKMTKFTPYVNKVMDTEEVEYDFMWQDEDDQSYLEISCDEEGRINRYYFYDNTLKAEKKLSKLSKEDVFEFAEQFLRKTIPEAFSDGKETLVFDQEMWSVNNLNYSLRYKRVRDGVEVKDNDVSIGIAIYDDVPYVRNMSAYLNYETEFEDVPEPLEGYAEKYNEAFPVELIYKDDARSYWDNLNNGEPTKPVLVYRYEDNNAGYILVSNGEVAIEDDLDTYGGSGGSTSNDKFESSVANAQPVMDIFTEQELAELEKIKTIISKEKAEAILKKIPHIGWKSDLKITMYELRSVSERYMVFTELADEKNERWIYATFDGETGELLDLYNQVAYHEDDGKELTESQKKNAQRKVDEFLKAVASEKLTNNYTLRSSTEQRKRVYRRYDRVEQGVRYISDGAIVEYDTDANMIVNYRMDFEEDCEFPSPEGVISKEEAYASMTNISPLKRLYVKVDGKYQVCYTVSRYGTEIDAFTGEEYFPYGRKETNTQYQYSDIEGHWAEMKINKLAEAQIGFEGEIFNPDEPATQSDVLRLFAAGVRYKSYLNYSDDDMYDEFIWEGILTESEKSPEGTVKREDAFKYMVRLDGLEEVAKLYDIFKVDYADTHLLTAEKLGYAAILSGMNIVCGNGGSLRPDEPITRAEVAVMVYNYMVK